MLLLMVWICPLRVDGAHASRLVALADVHGDVRSLMAALQMAGVSDEHGHWRGGDSVVVQTGDVVDRGNASLACLELMAKLEAEAKNHGGELVMLLGNHEWFVLTSDVRYASKVELSWLAELVPSGDVSLVRSAVQRELSTFLKQRATGKPLDWDNHEMTMNKVAQGAKMWRDLFGPRGPYARLLASRRVAAVRGDGACRTLFVHAALPSRVVPQRYGDVDALNAAAAVFLEHHTEGVSDPPPEAREARAVVTDNQGPLWLRSWAMDRDARVCPAIEEAVEAAGATRAIIGHTVQEEVAQRCHNHLTLLDVGMSDAYQPGGKPTAWECIDGAVRILTPSAPAARAQLNYIAHNEL